MAVLEAVRGWDALKPAEEVPPEPVPEDSNPAENEISTAPADETPWTDDRINELKAIDPLSVLLEHERHVAGIGSDDIANICERLWLSCTMEAGVVSKIHRRSICV